MSRIHLLMLSMLFALTGCAGTGSHAVTQFNDEAALGSDLPLAPLQWGVITFEANAGQSTMSTLFGNEIAVQHSRTKGGVDYPPGSVLSLVTWQRLEDGRWFGARMPSRVQSVEFVEFTSSEQSHVAARYRLYSGYPLRETTSSTAQADARVLHLVALRAAVMP